MPNSPGTFKAPLPEGSVAGLQPRHLHLPGAGVTEEVVAGEDVVDPKAVGTGESLADVALKQALLGHDRAALAIVEQAVRDRLAA